MKLETPSNKTNKVDYFAIDLLTGLSQKLKSIPSKYFYDDAGSDLFQKITNHPDYYLTKVEFSILNKYKMDIAEKIDSSVIDVIELGVGDGHKTHEIIEALLKTKSSVKYLPIDISRKAFEQMQHTETNHSFKKCETVGIVADYFNGISYASQLSSNPKLVLFLGSNIGNFDFSGRQRFLKEIWSLLKNGDYLLIGFDLKKDIQILNKAYNDSSQLTEKFNLNILNRINYQFSANFELANFQHLGFYNPVLGAMESYLISLKKQDVFIQKLACTFSFEAFEPIHLEYSFKYLPSDILELAKSTGYTVDAEFNDEMNYFTSSLWRVVKDNTQTYP